jgi:hypothetical protein
VTRVSFFRRVFARAATSLKRVERTSCAKRRSPEPTFARSLRSSQATGPREGAIINELFEDEAGALQLKFYCYLGLRDKPSGGPEEQAEQAQFDSEDKGYKAALLSTLARTRALVKDGRL